MRSILAVLAGYIVIAVGVIASTLLASTLILGGNPMDGSVKPTVPYFIVNITCGFIFAGLGGYVAASLSRQRPVLHAAALASLMLVLGFLTAGSGSGIQPAWYPPVITLGGAGFAVLGGYLRSIQKRQRAPGFPVA